jgi:hypothetical protein
MNKISVSFAKNINVAFYFKTDITTITKTLDANENSKVPQVLYRQTYNSELYLQKKKHSK